MALNLPPDGLPTDGKQPVQSLLDLAGTTPGSGGGSWAPNWNNGGMPSWIGDNSARGDDAAMVAHNMQLAMASQGANPSNNSIDYAQNQMGTPPPYTSGSTFGGSPSVFDPRNEPSLNGGWFNMNAYNQQAPPGTRTGSGAADRPSTNDWRLLPPQYRDPNYYAYNGNIIDRRLAHAMLERKSVMGQEGPDIDPGYFSWPTAPEPGTFTTAYGRMGIPGQLTPWSTFVSWDD